MPVTSSTLTSATPGVRASTAAIWFAARSIGSNSSPNTLTARSWRTPAINSLKRIWIGWEKLTLLPGSLAASLASALTSSSFGIAGSGHASRGFRMT